MKSITQGRFSVAGFANSSMIHCEPLVPVRRSISSGVGPKVACVRKCDVLASDWKALSVTVAGGGGGGGGGGGEGGTDGEGGGALPLPVSMVGPLPPPPPLQAARSTASDTVALFQASPRVMVLPFILNCEVSPEAACLRPVSHLNYWNG